MHRSLQEDLKIVLSNEELAEKIAERIERDETFYAFAGFYAYNEKLKLSEVLANLVIYLSRENDQLTSKLTSGEG